MSPSREILVLIVFWPGSLPHHQNLVDAFILMYNPTIQDRWLAMIEMRQIQFSLCLRVKQSRLHHSQFNTIIKTWTHTHNAFEQYKQWNNTTTTLKLILRFYSLLMSVCSDDSSANAAVSASRGVSWLATRRSRWAWHIDQQTFYRRIAS